MRSPLALLLLLFALPAAAGNLPVIEGVVVHRDDGPIVDRVVELARVTLRRVDTIATTRTDAHGRFELFGVPYEATYLIRVGGRGIYLLNVLPGQTHTLRATLSFDAICGMNWWEEMPNAARPHVWPQPRTRLMPSICE